MEAPIALFDMDGTLFDYEGQLTKDMKKLMAPGETEYEDIFDETKPYLKERMRLIKSQPGWWRDLPKLDLGWEVMSWALNTGYDTEILTKGPHSNRMAWAEKAECIDFHFCSEVTVNIVGKNKNHYYGRLLCDDFPDYMLGWLKYRPRGLGIMIANSKNAGFSHPNVIRYNGRNFSEVLDAMAAAFDRQPGEHWRDYLCKTSQTHRSQSSPETSLGGNTTPPSL
jgi:5'-nucleotidase